jgi:hypothetical protein
MEVQVVRGDNAALVVGGQWCVEFLTSEDDFTVSSNPALTVSLPDGTTIEPEYEWSTSTGVYQYRIDVTQTGRWVAEIAGDDFLPRYITAFALPVTLESGMPVVGDAVAYMGIGVESPDLDVLEDVFEAEKASQRARCRIPAAYPPDLRVALLRRVKRAWEMRSNTSASDADAPFTGYVPNTDPEVRRLEGPYRKVVLG